MCFISQWEGKNQVNLPYGETVLYAIGAIGCTGTTGAYTGLWMIGLCTIGLAITAALWTVGAVLCTTALNPFTSSAV